jgi:APA family basic amino acid/polyamine antiporter
VILAVTVILVRGVEESARANAIMVAVKVGVVLLVIVVGAWFVNPNNWVGFPGPNPDCPNPFFPFCLGGVVAGAGMVFFSFIGFDAVSTHAEETVNPGRNLPFGILVSLAICTVLYVGVAAVVTGMVPWLLIAPVAPVVNAFVLMGGLLAKVAGIVIGIGAIAGMTSVLLVTYSGQARIFRSMSRDGLLPRRVFAAEHPRYRSPHRSLILTALVTAIIAGVTPAEKLLGMVAIGTLLAFSIVCAAVMILRKTDPGVERPFRVPGIYVIAPLGIVVNFAMMFSLDIDAWIRLGAWLVIGLVVYFSYGYWNSLLRRLRLNLFVIDGSFGIVRLPPDAATPVWAEAGGLVSVTRTADEVSVVCLEAAVPEGVACERGWRCLRVAGAMPLSAVGVLASLTAPLASAGISVFAVSTFDTDYLLVRTADFENALAALRAAGHTVGEAQGTGQPGHQ